MKTSNRDRLIRRGLLLLALPFAGPAMSAACAVDNRVVLADDPDTGSPQIFQPPLEAGVDTGPLPDKLMCVATECPAPFATCGSAAAIHCGTNLLNDAENCGVCGNVCEPPGPNTIPRCINGKCSFDCAIRPTWCAPHIFKDCNGIAEDGCEVEVGSSAESCGTCGKPCPGDECFNGVCGCPAGKIFCRQCYDDPCIDPTNDDRHCGDCLTQCPDTKDNGCSPMPPNTHYGCANSACGALKCMPFTADCNQDMLKLGCNSDGCETDLAQLDPKNCGGCGNVCQADEECRNDPDDGIQCFKKCENSGRTRCGEKCFDLLSDPKNCGACNLECPSFGNAKANCRKGICVTECPDGFGDCNGNPLDGCETRLDNNPLQCGACGVACNVAAGQPCIEGKCLTVECDAGGPPQ
jgi:hypothetical protein